MSKRSLTLLLLSVLVMCFGAIVMAQETTGGIEGTVKDAAGAVVPNVTVTIVTSTSAAVTSTTGTGAGFKRSVTTNSEGFFRAIQVPPGTYTVSTAATGGFGEAKYENVTVAIGNITQLSITVNPGGATATVDVAASDAAPVDTTNSAIQTNINAQKIELLPKGTGFTSLLRSVPGTRPESRTGGFSVDGASGGENVFVIDGQEVTNYRTGNLNASYDIPTQLVREVQVKSSGFDAEFGGATGGVISIVSKGGANELHGEFGIQWEVPKFFGAPRPLLTRFTSGSVSANNFVQTAEYFRMPKPGGTNSFPTANLGGKIIENRLWYFLSYSPQIFDTTVTTPFYSNAPASTRTVLATDTFHRKRTYEYALARMDANPFNSLHVTGRFLWNPVIDKGALPAGSFTNVGTSLAVVGSLPSTNFGGNIGTLSGHDLLDRQGGRQSSNLVSVEGVYTPTSHLVFSGRYSRGFLNEKNGNYLVPSGVQIGVCPAVNASFPCSTTPSNTQTVRDVSIRENFEFSGSVLFNAAGKHELKGGWQRITILNDVAAGNTLFGRIVYSDIGTSINQLIGVANTPGAIGSGYIERRGTFGQGSNLSQGVYIQDKFQPSKRLTLNLGVRFEKENLPSFNRFPSNINFGWGDKIAPRLGFAYDLTGNGRTKVFASYGQFYDRVKFELPRGLFGGDIFLRDYFEIFPGETFTQFNLANIVGGFTGSSACPNTGFIMSGVRSRCQINLRVNANDPAAGLTDGAVDPNLEPFRQSEFTVGVERQISRDYVFRARYTYKNVDQAVEDAGVRNAQNSEAYIIGNPGQGLHLQTLKALGYTKSTTPQRRYDGLELVLEKRLSNNWYFSANYTYSRLYGNYSGLNSSDEPHLVNGRLSPGVTRAFDLPHIGFTAKGTPDNGRLQTDRPHVFNIYGAYIFDWKGNRVHSTELSFFQTATSGQPQTTTIYGASTVTPQIFNPRGDLGRTPTYTQTDFNVTHRYKFGREKRFTMAFDLNILNLWDQDTVTAIYTVMNPSSAPVNGPALGFTNTTLDYSNGYTNGSLYNAILTRIASQPDRSDIRYKMPYLYQSPRAVRFGVRLTF